MFKNLRIEEALAAEILGHEHSKMTYGRYGDPAHWQTLVDVLEKLDYPAPSDIATTAKADEDTTPPTST